ncbi:MAG: PCRF domain-containing protein, partial [Zetaproteobacteria bacterium]
MRIDDAKLNEILNRKEKLTEMLVDPAVVADRKRFQELSREYAELEPLAKAASRLKAVREEMASCRAMLDEADPELRKLAEEELERLKAAEEEAEEELRVLLLPKDPNDERNVILEIRAGTGGEEAALFAADLFRMYARYAERHGWKVENLSAHTTGLGGYKEIIALVKGKGAYSRLKFESGVHRVQRVPETESGGRIHTSAATVAVLPEAEEVEVEIRPEDLR